MKTDSYFEIGSSHDVCQDFALTGKINDKISFAIVADGCSESHKMSREVDFGARILSYAAREALKEIFGNYKDLEKVDDIKGINASIREKIIKSSMSIGKLLVLSELFSDTTLVIVISDGIHAYTFMYGDGGVIVCKRNGDIIYREVSFLSSAPYYLSYLANKERGNGYKVVFGASPAIITTYLINGVSGESQQSNEVINTVDEKIYDNFACSFSDFESISVISDGIKSYEKCGSSIKSSEIVSKFVSFKNKNVGFQQRRLNFLNKENKEANITHFDDISIATVLV